MCQITLKPTQQWWQATWQDYEAMRDEENGDRCKLFFDNQRLWVERGAEGINHAQFSALIPMLFAVWVAKFPNVKLSTFGGCQLEKKDAERLPPILLCMLVKMYPLGKLVNRGL